MSKKRIIREITEEEAVKLLCYSAIDVYVLTFEQEDSDYLELSNLVNANTLVDIRTVLTEREDKKFYIVEEVRQ